MQGKPNLSHKKKNRFVPHTRRGHLNDDPSTIPYSFNRVLEFYSRVCSMRDSQVGREALRFLRDKDYKSLIDMTVDPAAYIDRPWLDFAYDYFIVSFWKKYPDFDIGVDRTKAALDKWLSGEESNRVINETFRRRWEGISSFPSHVEEILYLSRCKIRDVLGNFDRMRFIDACRHGPGADLGTVGGNTSGYAKYKTSGHATPAAASVLEEYFKIDRRFFYSHECKLVDRSRLSFVLKNAKTDRAIEIGPRWNVFLQLGLGSMICEQMRCLGFDVNSQADRNRFLASRAQDLELCTLDLANASGTVATNLVIDLLTGLEDGDEEGSFSEWLDLILKLRVHYTEYEGKLHRLEMISGMGNGYTFPLETLIFYALTLSTCQYLGLSTENVSVFGDDIIAPRQASTLLVEVLSAVGFTTNVDKTFTEGEFYESCGHDYFRGRNVRPIFLKGKIDSVAKAFVLCNQVVAWGKRLSSFADGIPRSIYLARYKLTNGIRSDHKLLGPPCELDGVIHSAFDECLPRIPSGRFRGWEGTQITAFVPKAVRQNGYSMRGHLYSKLAADVQTRQAYVRRGDVGWCRKEMVVPWSDLILTEED